MQKKQETLSEQIRVATHTNTHNETAQVWPVFADKIQIDSYLICVTMCRMSLSQRPSSVFSQTVK